MEEDSQANPDKTIQTDAAMDLKEGIASHPAVAPLDTTINIRVVDRH
jgi:hypothetical protein